jgi:hypothetical protein
MCFTLGCNGPDDLGTSSSSSNSSSTGSAGSGCSGPGPLVVPPPDPPPEEEISPIARFCAAIVEPFCQARYACCLDDLLRLPVIQLDRSIDECRVDWGWSDCFAAGTEFDSKLKASLAAGTTVFDQATLDACIARLKPLAAGGAACVEPAGPILWTACLSAFRGQIAPGESCSWENGFIHDSFMQCKDGLCLDGRCVPFLKLADACSTSKGYDDPPDELCNLPAGEWCTGDGETGTCVPQGDVGDPCYGHVPTLQCKSRHCNVNSNTCDPGTFQAIACYPF